MKTLGAVNRTTLAFHEAYDAMKRDLNVDPVIVLGKLCKNRDPNIRARAAGYLVNKRYPNMIAIKPVQAQGEIEFTWLNNTPVLLENNADNDPLQSEATPMESASAN